MNDNIPKRRFYKVKTMSEKIAPITEHLEELRRVMLISLVSIFFASILSYFLFLNTIKDILLEPIKKLGMNLVFLGVTEGIFIHIKLALMGGIILASPIVLWQLLKFFLPALHVHEKRVFVPAFFLALFLFISGIFFAYKYALGLGLKVLLIDFSGGLTPMISISKYISFIIAFLVPFGIVFEIPIITYFLTCLGLITPQFLREKRGYVILGMFILAAVLSPGSDVISQLLMAIPMLILYELSIIISWLIYRKKEKEKEEAGL
ncbi:twin-arginine translocase subunit TatC [Thermanaerosceptrum fracticalcis]|uniref:Sec-independent protein translocase protein TatC n=2 Tax=Thermanaerosceptrum fracticalcis TaxID=1712410 RepID=A0A7G6E1E1_THEFR|nr:twin-arginine translocase subunit TatC [Thermanaerosceptrum fracticalcis]